MSVLLDAIQLAKQAAEGSIDTGCDMNKEAAAADPEAQGAVDALTRAQAAKLMGTGAAVIGAASGLVRGMPGGAAGMASGALGGAIGGGIGGGLIGGLVGKGAKPNAEGSHASDLGKRSGNLAGAISAASGAVTGGIIGATQGPIGALAGATAGAAAGGGVGYGIGRLQGWANSAIGESVLGKKKEASENMYTSEEIQMAKVAAEEVYNAALNEAVEKIAFAQALFNEADVAGQVAEKIAAAQKVAQDNGPALGVPYIDQVKTPAGAAALGAGAGVGGVIGYMKNPNAAGAIGGGALGAGVVAGVGALKAFIDQHRLSRAQQHNAELGNQPRA